jgi:hypothetical protein
MAHVADHLSIEDLAEHFPKWQEGRHPRCHFRGLRKLHSRYGPPNCSAA